MYDEEYLGDGVYASFDGYQVWLAVNDYENKVVALEPNVLMRLVTYNMRVRAQALQKALEKKEANNATNTD